MLTRFFSFILKFISRRQAEGLIKLICYKKQINQLKLAYNSIGILKYREGETGESFFIENVLTKLFNKKENLVILDVGANIGAYTKALQHTFKKSLIYCFEPSPKTYKLLFENTRDIETINIYNQGLGEQKGSFEIFTPSESQHSSIHKEVIEKIHSYKDYSIEKINLTTVDIFCDEQKIEYIDFMKIDTEGYEYNVLSGSKKMLTENKIGIIQFEFNEMNIVSRHFLKDFYDLLPSYNLYRLDTKSLIPIFEYKSINEIFQFQNIIAIHQSLKNNV